MLQDIGPWFVRRVDTHIAVGIFTCPREDLYDLVDEACEPEGCEYTKLAFGGMHFENDIVLHDFVAEVESAGLMHVTPTEAMSEKMFLDQEDWRLVENAYGGRRLETEVS